MDIMKEAIGQDPNSKQRTNYDILKKAEKRDMWENDALDKFQRALSSVSYSDRP